MKDLTLIPDFPPFKTPEDFSIAQFLLRKCKEHAAKGKGQYIVDAITQIGFDYADFEMQTGSIASFFYKRGMRRGDTLIYMPLDLAHLPTIFTGVWRANGAMRASYPEENEETIRMRVEESRAGWILCEESSAEMCLEIAKDIYWGLEVIVIGEHEGCTPIRELYEDDGSEIPEIEVGGERPALILCTSGTTGAAKGAIHTHTSLMAIIKSCSMIPICDLKRNLFLSKATHITGSVFPLLCMVDGKGCGIVMSEITKENLFTAVQRYQPGFIWGFPTFLLYLVNDAEAEKCDLTSIEYVGTGGAAFTDEQEKSMKKLPNLKDTLVLYGMTEVCPIATVLNFNRTWLDSIKLKNVPPNSTGKAFPGCIIQIRDLETNEPLGPNQQGEVCVKSNTMFRGYFNKPEVTEASFTDGWFRTGDIATYDEDGFIFIVDRYKDIFKYAGNHVSPSEIEEVLCQHPKVVEACVLGIPDPEEKGHVPRAYARVRNEDELTEELVMAIRVETEEKLASYKYLRGGLYIVSELPKGRTGKITRNLLLQYYEENEDKILASCLN